MMQKTTLAATLAATSLLVSVAFANDKVTPATPAAPTVAQKAVDRDVGKLSKDGALAFRDLHLARLAIFEADPARAKDLIGKAQTALAKAKTDDAIYMKAEAALRSSPRASSDAAPTSDKATAASDTTPTETKALAWLPVDAQLTLGEDFVATPAKGAAVANANKSLEKGNRKAALETLKLAGVDVNYVLAVVPLDQTTTDVDQAVKLITGGKYYEANATLKKAEDRVRFDVVDVVELPQKAAVPAPTVAAPPSK